MDLLIKRFFVITLWVVISGHPQGHLKPLGSHMIPRTDIDVVERFLSPWEFYDKYVNPSQPLLMKNVLENEKIPAYYKWSDDYLREHFGEETVQIELGKKEDRKNGKEISFKFSRFIDNYKDMDIYMVHDLPKSMEEEFHLPLSLCCGGFQKVINSVVTWFSSGSTKSVLHTDDQDNINCLLDGKKDLILFDKKYKPLIEADGWNFDGSYSDIDVDAVDMYKFPNINKIPWYQVNLTKGDCFYIPYHWFHQVYSHSGRNFATNVWFGNLRWFNDTDCQTFNITDRTLIPVSKFAKTAEIEQYRSIIIRMFEFDKYVSRDIFKEEFSVVDNLDKIYDDIDADKNGDVSFEEMYAFTDKDVLIKLAMTTEYSEAEDESDENLERSHEEL